MTLRRSLSEPWRVCLELAWESYRQGSLPNAAIIVDEQNAIVARGRNRLQDNNSRDDSPNAIYRYPLAHAEVNALLDFPFDRLSASRCTLLTTTEPCPLCVGAARMCSLGGLTYASRDPWAGSAALFDPVHTPKGNSGHVAGGVSTRDRTHRSPNRRPFARPATRQGA